MSSGQDGARGEHHARRGSVIVTAEQHHLRL
jgi:hypothetical protein